MKNQIIDALTGIVIVTLGVAFGALLYDWVLGPLALRIMLG